MVRKAPRESRSHSKFASQFSIKHLRHSFSYRSVRFNAPLQGWFSGVNKMSNLKFLEMYSGLFFSSVVNV